MRTKVTFVRQYTSPVSGNVFRKYRAADGRATEIIMRKGGGRDGRWLYTQAEATAEAKRRLS